MNLININKRNPIFRIQYSILRIQHSIFKIRHSLSSIQHSTFKTNNRKFNIRHSTFIFALITVLTLGPITYLYNKQHQVAEAAWWTDTWQYRKAFTATNGSAFDATASPYRVIMDTATPIAAGKMLSTGYDIRIVDNTGKEVRSQVEQNTLNTTTTGIWFDGTVKANSSAIYYVYYGNSTATRPTYTSDISSIIGVGTTVYTNDGFRIDTSTAYAKIGTIYKNGVSLGVNGNYHYTAGYPGNWWDDRTFTPSLLASGPMFAEVKMLDTNYGSYSSFGTDLMIFKAGFAHVRIYTTYNTSGSDSHYYYLNFDTATRNSLWVNGSGTLIDQAGDSGTLTESDLGTNWFGQRWTGTGNYGGTIITKNGSDWSSGVTSAQNSYYQTNNSYSAAYTNGSSREVRYGIFADNGTSAHMNQKASTLGAATTSFGSSTEEKSPAPIGYWKFDEGTGTTPGDSSGHGYTGSFLSAPIWKTEDQCISGKCLAFDNVDDGVSIANQNFTTLTDYTMCAWVNPKGNHKNYTGTIMSSGDWNVAHWAFGINQTNTVIHTRFADGTNFPEWSYTFPLSQWTYLCLTRSGVTITAYANGKRVGAPYTGTTGNLRSNATNTTIGRETYAGGYFAFNGSIDEPKIFNYARTAAQIKSDYIAKGGASNNGTSVQMGVSAKNNDAFSNGLVGYWKMDEASWTNNCSTSTVIDSSGNGNNGISCPNSTGPTGSVTGKFGNGGLFDGTNDYLDLGNPSTLNTNTTVTISAWVKPVVSSGTFANTTIAGNVQRYFLSLGDYTTSAPKVTGYVYNGVSWGYIKGDSALNDGLWHLVTMTYDGNFINVYKDGILDATPYPYTGTLYGSSNFYIGAYNVGNYTNSNIDEVRVYNRALSPAEVKALFSFAPGPSIYLPLEEGTGTSVSDKSGNNWTITTSGTPAWTSGKFGKAVNLNGNSYFYTSFFDYRKAFTQSAWIYLDSLTGGTDQGVFGQCESYATSKCMHDTIRSNQPYMGFYGNDMGSSATLTTKRWYYLTYVYDGANKSMYLDGVLIAGPSASSPYDGISGSTIFGAELAGSAPLNGKIDEIKIYNYARTQKQIVEDMNGDHPAGGSPVGSQVGYWKFDEGFGTLAYNSGSEGTSLNGTLTCGGTSCVNPSWNNIGKLGKSLYFTGSGSTNRSYINIPTTSSSVQLGTATASQLTFTMWVKPQTNPNNYGHWLVRNGTGVDENYGINLASSPSGNNYKTEVTYYNGGWVTLTSTNYFVPQDTWSHLSVVISQGQWVKFYSNGKYIETVNWSGANSVASSSSLTLGGHSGTTNQYLIGYMDEIKLYSSALTDEEIKLDYNQGSTLVMGQKIEDASDDPVGYWKLDESSGNSANNFGSGTGNATWSSAGTWVSGQINGAGNVSGQYLVHSATGLSATNGTIEAWVKPITGTDDYWGIWQTHDSASVNFLDWISLFRYGNTLYFRAGNGSDCCSNDTTFTATNYFPSDRWTHIAATWKGDADSVADDSMTVYVNGTSIVTRNNVSLQATMDSSARIGFGHGYTADGYMDEVKVYNYARSSEQIKADAATDTLNPSLPGAPVGEWKFEEGTGTTVNDSSGNGNAGSWSNGTGIGNWASGKIGKAGKFNGSTDYVGITDQSSIRLTTAGTLEAWVNPFAYPDGSHWQIISSKGNWAGGRDYFSIYYSGWNSKLNFGVGSTSANCNIEMTQNTTPLNSFSHLVLTWDQTGTYAYVNGILKGSASSCTPNTSGSNMNIGGFSSSFYHFGLIDQVQLYDYARTPAQIAYDFNRGAPIAHYKFDECQGTTANDSSGNGNSGTITIGASGTQSTAGTCTTASSAWLNGGTGKYNSSLNFDGTDDYVSVPHNNAFTFGTGDFTYSWWANHTALSGVDTYCENGYYYAGLLLRWQGEMGAYIQYATGADYYGFTWTPNLGQWYHMIIRRQSGNLNFFVNGVQVGTTRASTQNIQPSAPTFIGHSAHAGASQFFNGKLDDFRVYNYALNPTQIKTLYNNGSLFFGPLTGTP